LKKGRFSTENKTNPFCKGKRTTNRKAAHRASSALVGGSFIGVLFFQGEAFKKTPPPFSAPATPRRYNENRRSNQADPNRLHIAQA
jgi:hypothetical protein